MYRPHMPFTAPVRSDLPDVEIVQRAGDIAPGWEAPNGAIRYPGPKRIALYHQNYSGQKQWNTWANFDFPPELRPVIAGQNAQAGALNTLARVQAPGAAPRPIPLQDYALNTRMVYVGAPGTIDETGRIRT